MVNYTPEFEMQVRGQAVHEQSVADYMTTRLITFTPDQNIGECIETIIENRISGAPVVNDNQELVGIVSEKDCLKVILDETYHNFPAHQGKVANYMTTDVTTLDISTNLVDAVTKFINSNFRRFPIVQNGKMVGLIILHILKEFNLDSEKKTGKKSNRHIASFYF